MGFRTERGVPVPTVTAEQMREIDRIAVEEFGLQLLQMMENAGRALAWNAIGMLGLIKGPVVVLAGGGGNGGGGLCCARHLHNKGYNVRVILDRKPEELGKAAEVQLRILERAGVHPISFSCAKEAVGNAKLVIDALIGYGLRGKARGRAGELIQLCNETQGRVLSLDVPSGLNAQTGELIEPAVRTDRTVTLALPKPGLERIDGALYLADIGIPPEVFEKLGITLDNPFADADWVRLMDFDIEGV